MLDALMRLFAYALAASVLGLCSCRRGTLDAVDSGTDRSVSSDASPADASPGDASPGDVLPGDAFPGDAAPDGPGIPCGNVTCAASEICLYPPCGCIQFTDPKTDAGDCPDGEAYSDALGACFAPPHCQPPSCVSPAPGTGSFDCSEGDGGTCGIIDAPIPERCGHVCRAICV
jgi:hypothetical protein